MNLPLSALDSASHFNRNATLDARAPLWLDVDGSVRGIENAQRVDWRDLGSQLRYLSSRGAMERAKARLDALDAADPGARHRLALLGSGDFHHLSALLVGRFSRPLSLIIFDQHPDWDITSPWACCGCWVPQVLKMPHVRRVVVIGVGSEDLSGHHLWRGATKWLKRGRLEIYPATFPTSRIPARASRNLACGRIQNGRITWKTVEQQGMTALISAVLAEMPTGEVYISVDKDCLQCTGAVSNWGAGELEVASVCAAIERIGGAKRIVGADITGEWSAGTPRNGLFRVISQLDHWPVQPVPSPAALENNAKTNAALQNALVRASCN